MLGNLFDECEREAFVFVVEGVEVEYLVVDIIECEDKGGAVAVKELVESGFVHTVAFAGEPFDAVAVDGVVEFLLGGGDKYLCRDVVGQCAGGTEHPVNAVRVGHEPVAGLEQGVDEFLAAEALLFAEGVHIGSYCSFACISASLAAWRSARRAAAWALRSS